MGGVKERSTRHLLPSPSSVPPFLVCIATSLLLLSGCQSRPVIFNFGDSNSDTGTYFIMRGMISQLPPQTTFAQSLSLQFQGRMCDGRLVLDFLCESLNGSELSPYVESVGADFRNGVNFAMSGASTTPPSALFSLRNQVDHFGRFKHRSIDLFSKGDTYLPGNEEEFENGVYVIDIGQNDLNAAFAAANNYEAVQRRIPYFISEIDNAIRGLYQQGARRFWVHNTGPLGCLPKTLTRRYYPPGELDPHGCAIPVNNGALEFNNQLFALCNRLRLQMKGAVIVYVDVYRIKYDLIANASTYGFENSMTACCGYGGGQYNYNPTSLCGAPGFEVCDNRSGYVNWDGTHYTEAANRFVATRILSANYSTPRLALPDLFF